MDLPAGGSFILQPQPSLAPQFLQLIPGGAEPERGLPMGVKGRSVHDLTMTQCPALTLGILKSRVAVWGILPFSHRSSKARAIDRAEFLNTVLPFSRSGNAVWRNQKRYPDIIS